VVPPHSKSSDKVGSVNILAVDVGSSSIKLRVLDDDDTILAAIDALRSLRPDVSQVACFDTSFHTDMPARAATCGAP
jgi:acetate kinase